MINIKCGDESFIYEPLNIKAIGCKKSDEQLKAVEDFHKSMYFNMFVIGSTPYYNIQNWQCRFDSKHKGGDQ